MLGVPVTIHGQPGSIFMRHLLGLAELEVLRRYRVLNESRMLNGQGVLSGG